MALYGNPHLTGRETFFDSTDVIVSKTDLKGKITYANRTFLKMAQMDEKDILGQPHNIIRHPEMPRCVYKLLLDRLQNGQEVFAYVNNRAVNGDHYWVLANVTPSFNTQGQIINYHSNRRVPDRNVLEGKIMPLYSELVALEKSFDSPKEGLEASYGKIQKMLDDAGISFNEFMFSLNA